MVLNRLAALAVILQFQLITGQQQCIGNNPNNHLGSQPHVFQKNLGSAFNENNLNQTPSCHNAGSNLNLHKKVNIQQQSPTASQTNAQFVEQQKPQSSAIPRFSSIVPNGKFSGTPLQKSQGSSITNPTKISSFSSQTTNSYNIQTTVDQPATNPRNVGSTSNTSVYTDKSQASTSLPITINSSPTNQGTPLLTVSNMLNSRNINGYLQNQQSIAPVQVVQNQPLSVQYPPMSKSVQIQPSMITPTGVLSLLLPSPQTPMSTKPYKIIYATNSVMNPPKKSTKTSSLKALLPILFNLLKDTNTECACCPNYNREYVKNKNNALKRPKTFSSYSNLMNYGYMRDDTSSMTSSEELKDYNKERRKYRKHNNMSTESLEACEDDCSVEDNANDDED